VRSTATLRVLRLAAQELWDDDPEWFEGGCADVVAVLEAFARRLGLKQVRAEYGVASGGPHAWLRVGRRLYDPRADVEQIRYRGYRRSPGLTCEWFGVMEETVDWKVDELLHWWRKL
jgi:hypothetical protein